VIEVERRVLAANDEQAMRNRDELSRRGVVALNVISSPGAGKTTLLQKTLDALAATIPCAVIAGDPQTDRDAQRLRNRGAPVAQIETRGGCHLDARQVAAALPAVLREGTRLLFIENVGNLLCPAAFDLGEHVKVALLSVTEGEDKPLKYPEIFSRAEAVVLTKTDLLPHLEWDRAQCRDFLHRVHPGALVFELSARTGEGLAAWLAYLRRLAGA
jgi:hydrogenase nickel incorporation protein HypB